MFLLDTLKMLLSDLGVESDIAIGGQQAYEMVLKRFMDVDAGL